MFIVLSISISVLGKGVCYDQCVLLTELLAFALLHFVLQGQTFLLLHVSLDFLLLHSSPLWWKGHFWGELALEGLIGFHRTGNFSFFSISGWGLDLGYCGVEWFTLEMNWFGRFWDCTHVLHFGLFCLLWRLLHFFYGTLSHSSR